MKKQYTYLLILLAVTFVLYLPALNNKLNNWDDAAYILNNPHIELTKANVEKSFFQGEVHRMYAPLTALLNSIIHHFYGISAEPYIFTNLIIHLFNIVLIFIFISLLTKNNYVPIFTAMLFALHPMQVEAVAYAAGKRDVLYVFFFLLCLIFYISFLEKKNILKYILSLLFALLSLLSKGQALTIPFTLILISLFLNKKWNSKSIWIDKIPFFIFAVIAACKVFSAPHYAEGNFTSTSYLDAGIPIFYRLIYACYGFIQYIILLLLPYKLSLVHPYPEIGGKYGIPIYYHLFVIIFLTLIFFFFKYATKKKYLWFGLTFFAVNIFMLLQLIPNSYGIMNDHYVYFAGVGIFLIIGESLSNELFNKKYSSILKFIFIIYFIFLSASSFLRIDAFKNSNAVWSDVIKKYPECYMAYNNRGLEYYHKGDFDKAINDYSKVIEIKSTFPPIYNNRGIVYNDMGEYDKAINDYNIAIKLNSKFADAYYNRGNTLARKGEYNKAIDDYTKEIELDPNNATTYNNRGAIYDEEKIYDKAIADYTKAIELKPDYTIAYNNRGNIFSNEGLLDEAIADFSKIIELNPDNASSYNNRGVVYYQKGLIDKACNDFIKAADLGSEEARANAEKFCNGKN